MSMYPQAVGEIPAETVLVARAACPKGTVAMRIRDALGPLFTDEDFVGLYPVKGQPGYAPWRLGLVTILQYLEGLTDRQAADAVRERIDWKYALGLDLRDAGFDSSLLSAFRERLLQGGAETLLLDRLLALCRERGWLKAGGKMRTDSTHVLASVRALSHLELVGETLRAALEDLAEQAPQWLLAHSQPDWWQRYSRRVENYRLPKGEQARREEAERIGRDGVSLLQALQSDEEAAAWRQVSSVALLAEVWEQYYEVEEGKVRWRQKPQAPPGELISSPYDQQARCGHKRDLAWMGYKSHLSETCDEDESRPHLIVHVETTTASTTDVQVSQPLHAQLAQQELLPGEHLLDSGYVAADVLVSSQQQYGLRVLGPVAPESSWQARAGKGFDVGHFQIDWESQQVRCPVGASSVQWVPTHPKEGQPRIHVRFGRADCLNCPCQRDCTRSKEGVRELQLQPQAAHEALQARRQEQERQAFRQQYARRAGVEATLSQAVRAHGLRRARYLGLRKTHLQHIFTAVAINLLRLDACLRAIPRGKTRRSHLARLRERACPLEPVA